MATKAEKYIITATAQMKNVQQYVIRMDSMDAIDQKIKECLDSGYWLFALESKLSAEDLQAQMDAFSKQYHRQRYIVINADIDINGNVQRRGRKCVIPRRKAYLFYSFCGWMVHHEESRNEYGNLEITTNEKDRLHKLGLKIK